MKKKNKVIIVDNRRDAIIEKLIAGFSNDSQVLTIDGDEWKVTDLAGNLLAAGGDVIDLARRSGVE